jgi:hypothetical protein
MKSFLRTGSAIIGLLALAGCGGPASHSLVRPGDLAPGQAPASINVVTNGAVRIIEIDGIPGPNEFDVSGIPSMYNNSFTGVASVTVKPGPHKLRVTCGYAPPVFVSISLRVRVIGLNLEPGEDVYLHSPEQEKAKAQGEVHARTPHCPIRVESSLGRQVVLPDSGN